MGTEELNAEKLMFIREAWTNDGPTFRRAIVRQVKDDDNVRPHSALGGFLGSASKRISAGRCLHFPQYPSLEAMGYLQLPSHLKPWVICEGFGAKWN
jgi:hypothetical protein